MGRKGSKLIPFLMDALNKNKYNNLKFEDVPLQIFSLFLPQNTIRLGADCQFILKDWYKVKNRSYKLKKDYTEAKQGMEAALRKSDFLEVVHKGRNTKLIYRILNPLEIEAKKLSKKAQKKALEEDPYDDSKNAPSPESSGYGSGSDNNEVDVGHALLDSLNHDHGYILNCGEASLNEIKSAEDFDFVTVPLFPIENDALLEENGLRKIKMEQDENIYSMQLGYLEDGEFVINNEDLFDESALLFEPLENYAELYQLDPDLVTMYPDAADSKLDSSVMLNIEDDKLVDEVIMDWNEDLFTDSDENSVKEISTSGVGITSYKTKTLKVYECLHKMDMPDITMLTCEPKFKEFCVANTDETESSTSRLIFDEATMQLVSKCTLEDMQLLPNDHLLVFLKCKELIN